MSEFEVNLRSTTLQSTSSVVNEQLPVIRHVLLETDFSLISQNYFFLHQKKQFLISEKNTFKKNKIKLLLFFF
jgi:hypothetical protein